ncbi:MAG: hypothetical protein AAGG81_01350 [Chlamydiota bacterium]
MVKNTLKTLIVFLLFTAFLQIISTQLDQGEHTVETRSVYKIALPFKQFFSGGDIRKLPDGEDGN